LERTSPTTPISLPQPLRLFWSLTLGLSLLCVAVMTGEKYLLHRAYPYTFPFIKFQRWPDFFCFNFRFRHFHSAGFFSTSPRLGTTFMYPAPAALLYEGFYSIHRHSLFFFFALTGALVLCLTFILGKVILSRGLRSSTTAFFLGSLLLLSYPLWFEYTLANMEICIFLIVAFGLLAYLRGHLLLAAVLIGIAGSMKIFPLVYLALFLSRKKYREFALGILVAIVVNLAALWAVCPSLAQSYRGIQNGLAAFRLTYMLPFLPMETSFDHSLFGLLKWLAHAILGWQVMPAALLSAYLLLVSILGLALYFLRIRLLPLLNQILCLCIASILLPPTSHDYTLLHLYVPWGLMVLYALDRVRSGHSVRDLRAPFLCFAILFSAQSEFIYKSGYSAQLKAITLIILFVIALKNPWESQLTPTPVAAASKA
jgi:hypothetical protein